MPRGCDFETVLLLLPQLAAVEVRSVAVVDLDKAVHGIGWWKAYPDLDRQTRILLSELRCGPIQDPHLDRAASLRLPGTMET